LTTATLADSSFAANTDDANPLYVQMSADGTKLFVLADNGTAYIYEYPLGTAWDTSTIGSTTASLVVTPQGDPSDNVYDFSFGNEGKKLYFRTDDTATGRQQEWDVPSYSVSDLSALSGTGRGFIEMNGVAYCVIGGSLYSMNSGGGSALLGAVFDDGLPVGMAQDNTNLVITIGVLKYNYTVAGGLTTISDADLGDAYTVAYLDSRFYYDQPSGQFAASDLTDPTSINALNFATAEAFGDLNLAEFAHNQLMYACGQRVIEGWYTTGVGKPPVDRQFVIPRGLIGRRAIDSNERRIYILDHDRRPTWIVGGEYGDLSSPALREAFDSYTTVSDCIVNCYTWEQEFFAEYTFPTQNVTWVFHEASQNWTKREDTSNGRARGAFYVEAYNKLLALDHTTGKVWKFDKSIYQDNGSNITRTLDTQMISSEMISQEGLEVILNEVRVTAKSSGAATVSVSLSTDLATFGTARTITLASGVNTLSLYTWGKFREGILRFTTTSNAKVEIQKVEAALEAVYA